MLAWNQKWDLQRLQTQKQALKSPQQLVALLAASNVKALSVVAD
jgi:hypothetical protein